MGEAYVFQIMGLVLVAAGLGMSLNMDFYRRILSHYSEEPTAIYLNGIIATSIGFLLVRNYSSLEGWTALLTIIGWLTLLKGLTILIMPKTHVAVVAYFKNNVTYLRSASIAVLILGIVMLIGANSL
ncbi:MAG: hypothetical protein IT410_00080 [Candidatus Doudnabacteria bacterium]|nr:hypothetical protein [Candidatus Doudnabacteria bacterium]